MFPADISESFAIMSIGARTQIMWAVYDETERVSLLRENINDAYVDHSAYQQECRDDNNFTSYENATVLAVIVVHTVRDNKTLKSVIGELDEQMEFHAFPVQEQIWD